jgi:hypothetical protein
VPAVGGAQFHDVVSTVSHQAFLSGLRLAMVVGAAATLVGTLCGPFIRSSTGEVDRSGPIHF